MCTVASQESCHDANEHCVKWASHGFCSIAVLNDVTKVECQMSCGHCQSSSKFFLLNLFNLKILFIHLPNGHDWCSEQFDISGRT